MTAAAAEEKMADFVFISKISRFTLKVQLPRISGFIFFSTTYFLLSYTQQLRVLQPATHWPPSFAPTFCC